MHHCSQGDRVCTRGDTIELRVLDYSVNSITDFVIPNNVAVYLLVRLIGLHPPNSIVEGTKTRNVKLLIIA